MFVADFEFDVVEFKRVKYVNSSLTRTRIKGLFWLPMLPTSAAVDFKEESQQFWFILRNEYNMPGLLKLAVWLNDAGEHSSKNFGGSLGDC